jgi:hypothetical protein
MSFGVKGLSLQCSHLAARKLWVSIPTFNPGNMMQCDTLFSGQQCRFLHTKAEKNFGIFHQNHILALRSISERPSAFQYSDGLDDV